MRNDVKLKRLRSMSYLDVHKETPRASLNYRDHNEKLFTMLNFVKTGNNPTWSDSKWVLTSKLYQKIVESLKAREENLAFLNPSQAYEHLVARNVYESVLTINDKLIEETRERIRIGKLPHSFTNVRGWIENLPHLAVRLHNSTIKYEYWWANLFRMLGTDESPWLTRA